MRCAKVQPERFKHCTAGPMSGAPCACCESAGHHGFCICGACRRRFGGRLEEFGAQAIPVYRAPMRPDWIRADHPTGEAALERPCPVCHTEIGSSCVRPHGATSKLFVHEARARQERG